MKNRRLKVTLSICGVIGITSLASATIITSTDPGDFTLVPESFNYAWATSANLTSLSGNVTLVTASGVGNPATGGQFYADFAGPILPGNEYALNGDENFDVLFNSPQGAFAFLYVDSSVASTFTLNFYDGASLVGSTAFLTTSFNTKQFIGFASDTAFNKVTVRESDGATNSDEYFQFYSSEAIPEPSVLALVGIFGSGLWVVRRCFPRV